MSDLRPSIDVALTAFGSAVTVTPPDGPAVETTGIWLPPVTVEVPIGMDAVRREPRRVMALPKSDVPAVPRGTVIDAPAIDGGATRTWRVDEVDHADDDHMRVLLIEA